MEMVVTEYVDEEIVCDRIERAMAFLEIWSVIIADGSIKT